MKVTIKINGAEVMLEAQKPEELAALGPLAASILERSSGSPPKRTRYKTPLETGTDSELTRTRMNAVEFVLSTSSRPMNAPEVAVEVGDLPSFYTKSGDPVHIVRRVLAEGVQSGMFLKTVGGLFTTPPEPATDFTDVPLPTILESDFGLDDDDPFADS